MSATRWWRWPTARVPSTSAHVTGVTGRADFDAVLDAAILGEPALARVRDAGGYVGVMPGAAPAAARGVRIETVQVRPDGTRLAELVRLMDDGVLTLRIAGTYAAAVQQMMRSSIERSAAR
jgi:hypothetical protein